jgi:Cu/Ag efflux protein CusF
MRQAARVALALTALGLTAGTAPAQEVPAKGIFAGHGVVEADAPGTGFLTIAHDDIKGFMPAMKMMYKVKTPDLSKDLRPGDMIDFKIDAANYTIVDVKRVGRR